MLLPGAVCPALRIWVLTAAMWQVLSSREEVCFPRHDGCAQLQVWQPVGRWHLALASDRTALATPLAMQLWCWQPGAAG